MTDAERTKCWDELMADREAIERLALAWGDRFLALTGREYGEHSFAGIRPISFDRAEVADHLLAVYEGRLTPNEARGKCGLPPLERMQ